MLTLYIGYIRLLSMLVVYLVLLSFSAPASSAPADTLQLPDVVVSANRFDLPDYNRAIIVREFYTRELMPRSGNSLGNALTLQHTAAVRSYGPGAQTLSLLGFSGAQVQVLWNGQPLNHTMLGLVDFSIIPATLFGSVRVHTSQVSAESGGNAIGGMVELMGQTDSGSYQEIGVSRGAFGSQSADLSLQTQIKSVRIRLAGTHHSARNNYPYTDISQNPPQTSKRWNAHRDINGLLADVQYRRNKSLHSSAVWLNSSDAGIPGSIVAATSRASQYDQTLRLNHRSDFMMNTRVSLGGGFFAGMHQLDYLDPSIGLESLSTSYAAGGNVDIRIKQSQWQWKGSSGYSWAGITSSEYQAPDRHHSFVQVNSVWSPTRHVFVFPSARFDAYNDFGSAWSASLGSTYWILPEKVRVMGTVSSNFSPPTFNDLYWPELGNRALVAERSLRYDAGLEYAVGKSLASIYVFQNDIQNGIQWLPNSSGRFRPENILALQSRGLSLEVSGTRNPVAGHTVFFRAGGTFTRTTYQKARFPGDPGVGNQLRYQPLIRATAQLRYSIADVQFLLDLEHTGIRYLSESNLTQLPAYMKTDVGISYILRRKGISAEMSVTLENMLDTAYSQIQWYPMPGRHLHAGVRLRRAQH